MREGKLKKSVKIITGTLIIYGLLVATHLGEFWPFSIYPMFSQAGKPWKRAIVQNISHSSLPQLWQKKTFETLPGNTLALNELNVNTNDVANYLFKTKKWTERKRSGMRNLFKEKLKNDTLMVYQARGFLNEDNKAQIEFIPYIYLTPDTTILHQELKTQ